MSKNQIDPKILFNQAMVQKKNKDYLASIDTFNKITKIEPNIYEVFFNLGNIFFELRIFDRSILNFKKAINIYKFDPEAYTNLANAFIEKKMQFRNLVKIWSKDFNEKRDLLIQLNEALNKDSKEKKDLVKQKRNCP